MKLYMAAKKNNSDLVCSGYIKEKDGSITHAKDIPNKKKIKG